MAPSAGALARAILAPAVFVAGCATHQGLKPLTTDGCSLFPDRALIGSADWCGCCTAHDRLYWRGGTERERAAADEAFRDCIVRTTGNVALAETMLAGVRAGGTPSLPTPWRWGYGWPADRGYRALTDAERALVGRELARRREDPVCR